MAVSYLTYSLLTHPCDVSCARTYLSARTPRSAPPVRTQSVDLVSAISSPGICLKLDPFKFLTIYRHAHMRLFIYMQAKKPCHNPTLICPTPNQLRYNLTQKCTPTPPPSRAIYNTQVKKTVSGLIDLARSNGQCQHAQPFAGKYLKSDLPIHFAR